MLIETVNSPSDLKKLTIAQLKAYAAEVRQLILRVSNKNGGHLASNLGAVELSIALHYVFDCYTDKFIFDVGHQCYTHKIITGRRCEFEGLRLDGGLSGFPDPAEDDSDLFISGHSSSSLSLAVGLARARDLKNEDYGIFPIIGDGSFSGGAVFEALGDIGEKKTPMTIILNDNKMSISKNIGGISKYLTRLRLSRRYIGLKTDIKKAVYALPFVGCRAGSSLEDDGEPRKSGVVSKLKRRVRELFLDSRLFENFGISYYGPTDGHDLEQLIHTFRRVSLKKQPSIIHIVTTKGKGESAAEQNPELFHGVSASCDCRQSTDEKPKSFSNLMGETLTTLAQKDPKIVAISAAMTLGTGLEPFAKTHKDRFFDVAIAEQHAVLMAAGLAKSGFKPFFAVYSTFLQRGFDQLLHEVTLNNLPVRFLIDRAGAVGSDGITHQGIFDLSYLSLIPNMTVLSPKDGGELVKMLEFASEYYSPICIRYPKDYCLEIPDDSVIEYGKWQQLRQADSPIYILATGSRMVQLALEIPHNIINARFIKPLDDEFLFSINKKGNLVITLEDNILQGGFGQSVLSKLNIFGQKARIINLALPNTHNQNRDIDRTLSQAGLNKQNISEIISDFLKNNK